MEGYHQLPLNEQLSIQDLSLAIPPDQIRMIENIKTLISEVGFLCFFSFEYIF